MRKVNWRWISLVIATNIVLSFLATWIIFITIPLSLYLISKTYLYHSFYPHHAIYPHIAAWKSIHFRFHQIGFQQSSTDNNFLTIISNKFSSPAYIIKNIDKFKYFMSLDIINIYRTKCKTNNPTAYSLLLAIIHYIYDENRNGDIDDFYQDSVFFNNKTIKPREVYSIYDKNVKYAIDNYDTIVSTCKSESGFFILQAASLNNDSYETEYKKLYNYISSVFASYDEYIKTYKEWLLKFNNNEGEALGEWMKLENPILESEFNDFENIDTNNYEMDNLSNDDTFEINDSNDKSDYNNTTINEISFSYDTNINTILKELNELVGLAEVKEQVQTLINNVRLNNERRKRNLPTQNMSYHMIFQGNPGTGKTTVARIIAKAFKALGLLSKGNLIEVHREDFVGQYQGETAIKTKQIMNSARGNVLFIDEAYSLVHNGNDTFGNEAVNTIIAEMENNRNNMVVILAGYSKEMADFLSSNQGFKSRINRYITFSDYEAKDLVEIYKRLAKKSKNILDENAMVALKDVMDMTEKRKGADFGNARFVRNLYEKTIEEMNNRLSHDFSSISNKKLMEITSQDIYNAFQYIEV